MASWWRRFALNIGAEPNGRPWRQVAIDYVGLSPEDLSPGSGGWDRRIARFYNRMQGTGPWARHLLMSEPEEITNGVVHEGDPVFYEGVRVVHNG